jgi:hypothetical protein
MTERFRSARKTPLPFRATEQSVFLHGMNERQPMSRPEPPQLDPDAVCSECGARGAIAFDGIQLCPQCYSVKGSCCAESEKDLPAKRE